MAKSVTVLGLEGDTLRGVRLDASGDGWVRGAVGAWSLVTPAAPEEESLAAGDEKKPVEEDVLETEVVEDTPLVRAFRAAAEAFDAKEVVLSLPLSTMLVKTLRLPAEAREDILSAAQSELDGISPFPDELLTPGAEIMADDESGIVAICAALPDESSIAVSEALAVAGLHVLRTDVTALAWLRGLWPKVCEKEGAARRLVLLNLGGNWDVMSVENDSPAFLRGIGNTAGATELSREIMLSLLARDTPLANIDDVVVCSRGCCEGEILERLSEFGPVRTIELDDEFVGVEGAAQRTVEPDTIDVTPAAWREEREEARFRRKLMVAVSIAGGIWLAIMGVLFGVDSFYDFMMSRERSAQKDKKHMRAFKEVSAMTNRVVLIERYADHAHSALAVLKAVSDSLPVSDEMAFKTFQFRRDVSVRVSGSAGEREELRKFTEELEAASYDEDGEDLLFAKVQQTGGETKTKKGINFAIECFFHSPDEETGGRR